MMWFWNLLGWKKIDFGKNILWYRGVTMSEIDNEIFEFLEIKEETPIKLQLDVHKCEIHGDAPK